MTSLYNIIVIVTMIMGIHKKSFSLVRIFDLTPRRKLFENNFRLLRSGFRGFNSILATVINMSKEKPHEECNKSIFINRLSDE